MMATLRPVKLTALLLTLLFIADAAAINRIVIEADSVELAETARVQNLRVMLGLEPGGHATLRLQAARADIGQPTLLVRDLQLDCAAVVLHEPQFACRAGQIKAASTPLGSLAGQLNAEFQSGHQLLDIDVRDLALAAGQWQLHAKWQPQGWQLSGTATDASLSSLVGLMQPWWTLPRDFSVNGAANVNVTARGRAAQLSGATFGAELRELDLHNEAGSIATEHLRARLDATIIWQAAGQPDDLDATLKLQGLAGQALAGPVLLDFTANPLTVNAAGHMTAAGISLRQLAIDQAGLLRATGNAELVRLPTVAVSSAVIDVAALQFPAAYTSLLQLTLADGNFGALATSGSASGRVELHSNRLAAIDLQLKELDFRDTLRQLQLTGLDGDLHWRAASEAEPAPSMLGWQRLHAFGLEGGASTLQLRAHGTALSLDKPARIAIFDGALAVQRFDADGLGSGDVTLGFDASIEPISMQKLSVGFGWPEMSGQLSGRLPGLDFRNGTLSVAGDIVAEVFDGHVTASKLQLRNALGAFPRLSGDFKARGLDLELITRTFPIGSITGRLDADILALELFNWAPIAFDAHLYTTDGDRSRHRISQKAVGNLANIGGGGGGVTAALQSGFLSFFKEFGYDRIGLRCQLRNDVCLMDGIARKAGGFYIVKGGGLPRIDVIGNAGRVAWAQLVSQIDTALATQNVIVR